MRHCGMAAALIAIALTACQTRRVDVVDRPAGSFAAVARAKLGEGCPPELRERAVEEARYFCKARGRKASLGTRSEEMTTDGCVVQHEFWCRAE